MEKYYKKYTITTNMLDANDNVKPSSILDIAQEIAGEHADHLGVGFLDLYKEGLIWVIVRNKVTIFKSLKNIKYLDVYTYPIKPNFIEIPRDTEFYYNEELVAVTRSIWMIYDINSNELAESFDLSNLISDFNGVYDTRVKRIKSPEKELLNFECKRKVLYSMLDHNKHLNNTKYLDFYNDIFKDESSKFISFQAEYLKQGYLDEEINIYSYKEEKSNWIVVYNSNEEIMFYVKFDY